MSIIKRKISYEPATVRISGTTSPWGTVTASTFYLKVMFTQNMDDMGIYTDINFTPESNLASNQPDYTILTNKLILSGITFPFMSGIQPLPPTGTTDNTNIRVTGKDLTAYYSFASKITGATESKKEDVRSYSKQQNYITGFDINKVIYTNYLGNIVDGRTRVTAQGIVKTPFSTKPNPRTQLRTPSTGTTYVFDANNDANIGTTNQSSGILYTDYSAITRTVINELGDTTTIGLTEIEYTGEGWNETNTSLSANTKEEYLFGITQPPEVFSDVFIERGTTTVHEKHLRLSEVESLEHLERYNNGFYNLVKQ